MAKWIPKKTCFFLEKLIRLSMGPLKCRSKSSSSSPLLRTDAYRIRGVIHFFWSNMRRRSTRCGFEIAFICLMKEKENVLLTENFNRCCKKKYMGPKNILAGFGVLFASSLILYMDRVVRDEKPKTSGGTRRLYAV